MTDEKDDDFIKNLKDNTKKVLEILSDNKESKKDKEPKKENSIDMGERI